MSTFLDLFAGIGGFRQGLTQQGFTCVGSSEINEHCRNTYYNNYGEMPLGDITQIDPTTLPDHDVLVGGFPCQPFSICGKRLGFNDTRGTLFFNVCEIIRIKQPSVVLLENVKNLKHHDGGRTLQVILASLTELGYNAVCTVLNASDFGVPQSRERTIIVGTKHGTFDFSQCKTSKATSLIPFLDRATPKVYLEESEYTLLDNPVRQKSGLIFAGYLNKNIRKAGVREGTEHLSRAHKQPNRIYSARGVHPTLPSQETSGRFYIYLPKANVVRKLTLLECYRITGFPDDFKRHPRQTEAYRQIGNSICVSMVSELARQLVQQGFL